LEHATLVSQPELTTLAMSNIGRCQAAKCDYLAAIETWGKVTLVDPRLLAWQHHEMGRCYLELYRTGKNPDHLSQAVSMAQSCHRQGSETGDRKWEMAAKILQGEACREKGDFAKAAELFDTGAHDAGSVGNDTTQFNCNEAAKACRELAADKAASEAAGAAADASTTAGIADGADK
jgi:hypothetical protein